MTIPNTVTNIGIYAFGRCTSLIEIDVDALNPVYSSVDGVLLNKSQTTLIQCPGGKAGRYIIPNSVTFIGEEAFLGCTSLTSVTIPNSVTAIAISAFGETSLTNVTIPDSVTRIGQDAFSGCTSLASVTIPSGVTDIAGDAFSGCTALASVTIPNNVTRMGQFAFEGCTGLTNVTILDGVTIIGPWAFQNCTNLSSVTIPKSVTQIGQGAFSYCTSLRGVYFLGNAPSVYSVGDGSVFSYDPAILYYLPGTTGWKATFSGLATALWPPQVQTSDPTFGVQSNRFGFTITWASNQVVVIEGSTDLSNPTWSPVATNILAGGTTYFNDPQWANYPRRFYRLRSP